MLAAAVPLVEKAGEYPENFLQVTVGAVGLEDWHSVTVTWSGGTTSDGLTLYVDGIAGTPVAGDMGTYTAMPATASPTNFGNEHAT